MFGRGLFCGLIRTRRESGYEHTSTSTWKGVKEKKKERKERKERKKEMNNKKKK